MLPATRPARHEISRFPVDLPLPNQPAAGDDAPVLAAVAALWLQLFCRAVPFWRFGEYYAYGWFVPPLAGFFFYRRWRMRD